jgi:hypothetical protein
MKKYLLYFICLVRRHRWRYEATGAVMGTWNGGGIEAHRYRCARCGQYLFAPTGGKPPHPWPKAPAPPAR